VIDLHLHTTASDGRSSPEALVEEAAAAGIRTLAVTDHDTMAAVPAAARAAAAAGLTLVPGIEITAVHERRDVHILGYYLDADHPELSAFLVEQRARRRRRIDDMLERLAEIGAPVDAEAVRTSHREAGRAIGRPVLAAALVAAGHARDIADAFDRYLALGRPAFVPRQGASLDAVVGLIGRAGGLASIAHPGKMHIDAIIPDCVTAGLAAIEVFHPDHSESDVLRYAEMASALGVLVTGGSDYHGPGSGRTSGLGIVGLPAEAFARFAARAVRERA